MVRHLFNCICIAYLHQQSIRVTGATTKLNFFPLSTPPIYRRFPQDHLAGQRRPEVRPGRDGVQPPVLPARPPVHAGEHQAEDCTYAQPGRGQDSGHHVPDGSRCQAGDTEPSPDRGEDDARQAGGAGQPFLRHEAGERGVVARGGHAATEAHETAADCQQGGTWTE